MSGWEYLAALMYDYHRTMRGMPYRIIERYVLPVGPVSLWEFDGDDLPDHYSLDPATA